MGHAEPEAVKELAKPFLASSVSNALSCGKRTVDRFSYSFPAAFLPGTEQTRLAPRVPRAQSEQHWG
jgi:hypothetical protein